MNSTPRHSVLGSGPREDNPWAGVFGKPQRPVATGLRGLKAHREAAGLTQLQLAARAGVGQDTVSRIEGGKQKPHDATAHRLAEILNVPMDDLFPNDREQT